MDSVRISAFANLLLLHPHALDLVDLQRRTTALFRELAVLLPNEAARGFVAVEAAEQLGRHAGFAALGAVFVDDVEEGEFALQIGTGFFAITVSVQHCHRNCVTYHSRRPLLWSQADIHLVPRSVRQGP